MSRVGKKPVSLPKGVTATIEGQSVQVKGAKGTLSFTVPDDCDVALNDNEVSVKPRSETKRAQAMWGMSRAMINNLVTGVSAGFERKLEITGVGYKAAVQGKKLVLSLGYSHDVDYPIPDGIDIKATKPTELVITGIDKREVGQVASEIRSYRPPEPYKGKGVKYAGEFIFRKEGKKK
ncbi:50S ribosomal protein L6 [Lichenibacterium minor]|uniref:Large ribosomal subunit protein uL6 n=1 Tax=Lichenibacterium minor TaxID=2316528 RepID=A0A4Q2UGG7_9HYPH|nr:50S ribosomal protein L6 [Lichenibacterium minor]RYC33825.1 50S ribosomal protein L6 [Lichenibacterium minor]